MAFIPVAVWLSHILRRERSNSHYVVECTAVKAAGWFER